MVVTERIIPTLKMTQPMVWLSARNVRAITSASLLLLNLAGFGLQNKNQPERKFQNHIFHFTRCITPKRVMSLRGPSLHYCARAIQLFSKKHRTGGEP